MDKMRNYLLQQDKINITTKSVLKFFPELIALVAVLYLEKY